MIVSLISFILMMWALIQYFRGDVISGWASTVVILTFLGGIQILSIGLVGEYIGKIYMESKNRPRYIISERTYEK